jgi:SAM-dependent methyltransferase
MLARADMLSLAEESLLSVLACPMCKGVLSRSGDRLRCTLCAREFTRDRGYWSLLSDDARQALMGGGDRAWSNWRDALEGLERWRERNASRASRARRERATTKSDGSDDERTRSLIHRALGDRAGLIVDVGAKDGRMRALAPSNCEYIGIDPMPRGDGSVLRAVAEALPLRDRCAQLVLCHAAFDYFVDPSAALVEMHRVLVPGGALALVVSTMTAAVAHARGASSRVERLLGVLRASSTIGVKGAMQLLGEAIATRRSHLRFYTRAQVLGLIGVRFDVKEVQEVSQPASTILYIHGTKRTQRKLTVL